jgi:hypothetical protein
LYEQAEAVYRKYSAEDLRIFRAGGISEPTPILLETTTGAYQAEAMTEYRGLVKSHGGLIRGTYGIAWFKPVPEIVKLGSVATLEVCVDISSAVFRDARGKPYSLGADSAERLYFVRDSEQLKISSADHQKVKSC